MAVQGFVPEIWSALISKILEKTFVYGACANTDYEGEIKGAGDRVRVLEVGEVTVSPYVKNSTTLSYQGLQDAEKWLIIDQSKYWAFKVDDVEKVQSKPDVMAAYVYKAAYAVADTVDQYLATMYAKAGITTNLGTSGTPIEINSANIDTCLIKLARLMDDNNVPRAGRWVVMPPFMHEDLVIANLAAVTDNAGIASNGLVGRYAGFDLRISNNVPNTTKTKYACIAGINQAISFASQIAETESLRLEDSFATAVRGLYLYGAEVLKPAALACLWANEAAEA